jgi:hypothetical protein
MIQNVENCHAFDTQARQSRLDFVQLEGLDNRLNFYHVFGPLRINTTRKSIKKSLGFHEENIKIQPYVQERTSGGKRELVPDPGFR